MYWGLPWITSLCGVGISVRGLVVLMMGMVVSGLLTDDVGVPEMDIIIPFSSRKTGGIIVPKRVGVWKGKDGLPETALFTT